MTIGQISRLRSRPPKRAALFTVSVPVRGHAIKRCAESSTPLACSSTPKEPIQFECQDENEAPTGRQSGPVCKTCRHSAQPRNSGTKHLRPNYACEGKALKRLLQVERHNVRGSRFWFSYGFFQKPLSSLPGRPRFSLFLKTFNFVQRDQPVTETFQGAKMPRPHCPVNGVDANAEHFCNLLHFVRSFLWRPLLYFRNFCVHYFLRTRKSFLSAFAESRTVA
jgi:hypothetical protein